MMKQLSTFSLAVAAAASLCLAMPTTSQAQQKSGRDLVDNLCSGCHGADAKTYLQGASMGTAYAPELSNNPYVGLGKWSVAEIVEFLKAGGNRRAVAAGMMADVVTGTTQSMSNQDLTAIAELIKSLPGSDRVKPAPIAAGTPQMVRGKTLYETNCSACHDAAGTGVPGMVPALDTSAIQAPDPTNLIRTVLQGGTGAVTTANPTGAGMPSFDWKLDDDAVAAALTYVRNAFGNAASAVEPAAVAAARTSLGANAALK